MSLQVQDSLKGRNLLKVNVFNLEQLDDVSKQVVRVDIVIYLDLITVGAHGKEGGYFIASLEALTRRIHVRVQRWLTSDQRSISSSMCLRGMPYQSSGLIRQNEISTSCETRYFGFSCVASPSHTQAVFSFACILPICCT